MRRLSLAGFKADFLRPAVLPDWWDDECVDLPELLPDVEIRVSRFLEVPLAAVKDPSVPLAAQKYPNAQLRRVRDIDGDRLAPAIHAALRIGAAVVRSLSDDVLDVSVPPDDGLSWRQQMVPEGGHVTLDLILGDLWARGIPVIPVDVLPSPSFQGIACIVEGRPVILLGHRHDGLGHVAHITAHEVGHITAGDCAPDQPVVDEEDDVEDNADIELRADLFATRVLVGGDEPPQVEAANHRQLATRASQVERETGADAGAIISAWASRSRDFKSATMAINALYRGAGARRKLRQHFDRYVDLEVANESDRALLRCVYGDPGQDERPD